MPVHFGNNFEIFAILNEFLKITILLFFFVNIYNTNIQIRHIKIKVLVKNKLSEKTY